ncbi:hypothetical protein D5301_03390 [Stenotrophomonas sp. MH181796]|nr:hypothetical protein [Stenotrophomonas sp. MH181796]
MAGGTGGPYDVGVSRSWPIFSVAAATTFTACSGLVVRAFPLIPAPSARPLEQLRGLLAGDLAARAGPSGAPRGVCQPRLAPARAVRRPGSDPIAARWALTPMPDENESPFIFRTLPIPVAGPDLASLGH